MTLSLGSTVMNSRSPVGMVPSSFGAKRREQRVERIPCVDVRSPQAPRKVEHLGEVSAVAAGPLREGEGFDLLRNAKSCEPEGPQDLTQRL